MFSTAALLAVAPLRAQAAPDYLHCERFLVKADLSTPKRPLEKLDRLRIGSYNVENLFLHLGHHEPVPGTRGMNRVTEQKIKPLNKIDGVARAILDMKLDIVVVQEVEDIEALQSLAEHHLNGEYQAILVEGNDPRGIDVGFLIKKDLPFEIENHSFRKETWVDPRLRDAEPSPIFSRDLPALVIRAQGAPKDSAPLLVLLGTHFKSKRPLKDPNAIKPDPESAIARGAQVKRAAEIILRYKQQYGNDLPIMLAGDFNGAVNLEPEFRSLHDRAGMDDAFDVGDHKISGNDRVTHVYFPGRGEAPDAKQMDAIFVSPELKDSITKTGVYRYKRNDGKEYPLPRNKHIRDKNPSDHFPIGVEIETSKLKARAPKTQQPQSMNNVIPLRPRGHQPFVVPGDLVAARARV
ncbi:MAG: hypothetical protein HY075_06925 [Deltaproteobacteria bacterium]|nr:hypothetical protein [Deltaproteobacteria bacterium]